MKHLSQRVAAAFLLVSTGFPIRGSAAPRTIHYVAAMKPRHAGVPYTGALTLTYASDGIVSGTYRAESIRPDPLRGHIVSVMGGITGNRIHFSFGQAGAYSFNGTRDAHGRIEATGFGPRGALYEFEAVPDTRTTRSS